MFKLSWASKATPGRPGACTFLGQGALEIRARYEGRARKQLPRNIGGNNDRYDNDSPIMTMMSLLSGPVGQETFAAFLMGIFAFFPILTSTLVLCHLDIFGKRASYHHKGFLRRHLEKVDTKPGFRLWVRMTLDCVATLKQNRNFKARRSACT
ncbi:hypothetical protein F5883DRAFT_9076 [Diaporthe sp. PMI_573]|jgi:hypothetical protein|nr:hypothetical protein F5883DRAFT_9076 [Diaporthaceae sp. PMI_573]